MRPLRDVKQLVRHAPLRANAERSRAVLDELRRELGAGRTDTCSPAGQHRWSRTLRSPLAGGAGVAALILVVALVMVSQTPKESTRQPLGVGEVPSAADMLTVGSLNAACRRGGLPEVERQCEQAAQRLDIRPERISAGQLTREMNGT